MVETCGAARLLQEALLFVLVREEGTGEELDRDVALQSMIAREVDGPHPTFAEPGKDFVFTESQSVLYPHRESECSAERGSAMNARVVAFSWLSYRPSSKAHNGRRSKVRTAMSMTTMM